MAIDESNGREDQLGRPKAGGKVAMAWDTADTTIPARLMKVPFASEGRSAEGADCYGWVRLVLKEVFAVEAPPYPTSEIVYNAMNAQSCSLAMRQRLDEWRAIQAGSEQPGDLVLLIRQGRPCHCGVVLGAGQMAHLEAPPTPATASFPCVESYREGRW